MDPIKLSGKMVEVSTKEDRVMADRFVWVVFKVWPNGGGVSIERAFYNRPDAMEYAESLKPTQCEIGVQLSVLEEVD